ncbi:MAG: rod shape-determining protein RodA [Firmicutes bacterium]|nr:rod shape-determining protein RodA [Bacillota bacterium]
MNWKVLLATVLLIAVGLLFVYSATCASAIDGLGSEFKRQLVFVAVGLVVLVVVALMDYRDVGRFAWLIYALAIGLLLVVSIFGGEAKGAQRWIYIGGFSVQPSEIAKLAVIIALAKFFSERKPPFNWKEIVQAILIVAIPTVLVMKQPDIGTGIVFVIVSYGLFFLAGFKIKHLVLSVVLAAASSPPVYLFLLKDYQKNRIKVFLDPNFDVYGAGYNVRQSKIAVGSGRLWGKGLFNSTQSQLNWLPEHHTDYIFAVIAEEIGFIGCMGVLALYFFLIYQGIKITLNAVDRFGALLAGGITLFIFSHVIINIGGAIGLMPSTGLPLPFVSYGVNNLLVNMVAIGLLLSISMRQKKINFYGIKD